MIRAYKPKRLQQSGVWISDDGLPPADVSATWKALGPTGRKNAQAKLRQIDALIAALKDFQAGGLPLPLHYIHDEHLWNPLFIEALRICEAFTVLDGYPPEWKLGPVVEKEERGKKLEEPPDNQAETINPEYQNAEYERNRQWAAHFMAGGTVSASDRFLIRDKVRYLINKSFEFIQSA